jgi:microcystin-dependent protein
MPGWTLRGNLEGPPGPAGPTGPVGTVYDTDQVGTVKTFAGTTVPANWMLADGRSLSRVDYPDLFAVVGTRYGAPDGATFRLPDLRSRFVYGSSAPDLSDLGVVGGEAAHALSAAEMPSHSHVVNSHAHGGGNHDHGTWTGYISADHSHGVGMNNAGSHAHGTASGLPFAIDALINNAATGTVRNSVTGEEGGTGSAGDHGHGAWTGGVSSNHQHQVGAQANIAAEAPGTNAQGGGTAHNNIPPYVLLAFIVKVKGVQVDAGGALVGPTGPQGPQGIPGPVVTYVHTQTPLAALWTVTHNLNRYPSVTVVDSGGSELLADLDYVSANEVTLGFGAATSGKAYLN